MSDLTVPSQNAEVQPPPRTSDFLSITHNSSVVLTAVSFFALLLRCPRFS